MVVLRLVVTIFIKLLFFGYSSSSPWSWITPQATRPPALPVFLLPSSASPVPLRVKSLKFGIWYAGQLSLIESWMMRISLKYERNLHAKVVRPSVDHDGPTGNVPKHWKSADLDFRSSGRYICFISRLIKTDLTPPSPRVRILSTRSMLVGPKRGVAMFPRSPAWLSLASQERITWMQSLYGRDKTRLAPHGSNASLTKHCMKLLLLLMFNRGKEWGICSVNSTSSSVLHLNMRNRKSNLKSDLCLISQDKTWLPPDQGWSVPRQPGSSHWCCPRHEHGTHEGLSPVQPPFRGSLRVLPRLQEGWATGGWGISFKNAFWPLPAQCTGCQIPHCWTPVWLEHLWSQSPQDHDLLLAIHAHKVHGHGHTVHGDTRKARIEHLRPISAKK